jgi:hypothetical protein
VEGLATRRATLTSGALITARLRVEWGKYPRGEMGRASGLDKPDEFVEVNTAVSELACQLSLEAGVQEPLAPPRGD